jgi:HKD family nuclease
VTIQPARFFNPRWEVFWCTTYSFELELFDEYLFRRLGDPPLNATVLVDFATLAKAWEGIQQGEEWRLQRVNRRYLVRAAGRPQGRFHPKTYFFGNDKEGTLLVGSGNLSLWGIEEGSEVFSQFDSADDRGLAAILSWRDWIKTIVDETDDDLLGQRWFRLRQTTKGWLRGAASSSSFVTNSERSLLDQVFDEKKPCDELLVTAPFFDKDVEALGALLKQSRAMKLSLYLGRGTSVDGAALRRLLKTTHGKVEVFAFDPPRFVHAKIIALIQGQRARVLTGSANLSRAALTSSLADATWANTEAGVLTGVSAKEARDLFHPPNLKPKRISLNDLVEFSFQEGDEPLGLPLRLHSARPSGDGTILVNLSGKTSGSLFLSSDSKSVRLEGFRTVEAFNLDSTTVLVWLSGEDGEPLSNRVPIDDPAALQKQLEKSSNKTADRPRELDASDMQSPIGKVLVRLHNEYIFDIDDLDSVKQAERANEGDDPETEQGDFWERLAREELQLDPRAGGYRRLGREAAFDDDDVLLLLRLMLERTPEERHGAAGEGRPKGEDSPGKGSGKQWTPTQRLQVRLMNVLTRWARALTDPRMNWLQPYSSVRNFQVLLYAIAELWELDALPESKLIKATELLFGSFVRSEEASGYLFSISEDERAEALTRLSPEAGDLAAALIYLGLRPKSNWQGHIFDWQVWLTPLLEAGAIRATSKGARLVSRIGGERIRTLDLAERINWASSYIDDERWCKRMRSICSLTTVRFSNAQFAYAELVLEVEAEGDLIDHPGIVRLIRSALDFRGVNGLVIMDGPQRVAVRLGDRGVVRLQSHDVLETREDLTKEVLRQLEESGLSMQEIVETSAEDQAAAS